MASDKKVLLIMPRFFDYPEIICDELNRKGYEVDYYDDRPSTSPWIKAIIRINKDYIQGYIQRYFSRIMEDIKSKTYDIVFLISGQSLSFSEEMIACIKKEQPHARFLLYQWDSQRNFPYIKKVQKYFDKIYSFDKEDVETTEGLLFLPLFYSRYYKEIGETNEKTFIYDFCFVGTAHPKKYKAISEMSDQLKTVFPNQFIYYYFPSRIVYIYRKIHDKEFKKARYKEFHFRPLGGKDMEAIYKSSRCILDSAQEGQKGLTIRSIEALGAKKKLITTNEDIINYDFYRPENIYIYKGKIDTESPFFSCAYTDIRNDVYQQYSLSNWLEEIMS